MKEFLLLLLFGYLALGIVLYVIQRSVLYYPQAATETNGIPEVTFEHNGQTLNGWILNAGQNRALIYYGGNAEAIELNIAWFQSFLPDRTIYLIPYRGYGKNTGKPTEQSLYADALFIFDQIKDLHDDISLLGRSLGTGVATYVAVNRKIEKLVLVTPYDSIENVAREQYPIYPMGLLFKDKYLSLERAPDITVKTLVLIAENDKVISRKRTENLISKFELDILTTMVIARSDHNNIIESLEYCQAVKGFLE